MSDLHLGKGEFEYSDDKLKFNRSKYTRYTVSPLFWEALKRREAPIDALVVSGDITNRNDQSGYNVFVQRMRDLPDKLFVGGKKRVIVVPGNHDVEWDNISAKGEQKSQRYKNFVDSTTGFTRPWLIDHDPHFELASSELRNLRRPYEFDHKRGLFVYALNSATMSGRTAELSDEEGAYIDGVLRRQHTEDREEVVKLLEKVKLHDAALVGIEQLSLLEAHIEDLREIHGTSFDESLKVAVLHHHLDHIASAALEVKSFEMIMDGGPVKKALLQHGFHIVLHGHKHHWNVATIQNEFETPHKMVAVGGGTVGGAPSASQPACFTEIRATRSPSRRYWNLDLLRYDLPISAISSPELIWERPSRLPPFVAGPSRIADDEFSRERAVSTVTRMLLDAPESSESAIYIDFIREFCEAVLPGKDPLSHQEERNDLLRRLDSILSDSKRSLYAVDVLGPQLWLQPEAITYFGKQVVPYLARNVQDGVFKPCITSRTHDAARTALENFDRRGGNYSKGAQAAGIGDIIPFLTCAANFTVGSPELELCRVLIWDTSSLVTPTAETVVRLHEQFRVPLFFVDRRDPMLGFGRWRDPEVDYVFSADIDGLVVGFYGYANKMGMHTLRRGDYPPLSLYGFDGGRPRFACFFEEFAALLKSPSLLLASHALVLGAEKSRHDFVQT